MAHVKMNFHLATLIRFLLSSSSLPGIRKSYRRWGELVTFLTPESLKEYSHGNLLDWFLQKPPPPYCDPLVGRCCFHVSGERSNPGS